MREKHGRPKPQSQKTVRDQTQKYHNQKQMKKIANHDYPSMIQGLDPDHGHQKWSAQRPQKVAIRPW
jgi:hypothetical protein